MIVEDESLIALYLKKVLESHGHEIQAIFSTGEEALECIGELMPDLIIMDVVLAGDLDGVQTAAQIHNQFNIPIIYLTGYDEKLVSEQAKATEPFWCLLKPFRMNELRIAVDMSLYRHSAEQKLRQSEEKYRLLIETMNEGLLVVNAANKITFVNDRFLKWVGYDAEEIFSKNVSDFLTELNREFFSQKRASELIDQPFYFELNCTTKYNAQLPVIASIRPILTGNGYEGFLAILMDVSKLRDLQRALKNSEEKYRFIFNNIDPPVLPPPQKAVKNLKEHSYPSEIMATTLNLAKIAAGSDTTVTIARRKRLW